MPPRAPYPSHVLQAGDGLEVTDVHGRVTMHATLVTIRGRSVTVRLGRRPAASQGVFRLHWLDAVGCSWQVEATGRTGPDPLNLALQLTARWRQAAGRRAVRFPSDRRMVRAQTSHRPTVRELVTLDVSATGCCVTGSGEPLPVGTKLAIDITPGCYRLPSRLHAVVVRVLGSAFGRFELGLRFEPTSAAERRLMLNWRDETALASAVPPMVLVAD